MALEVHIGRRTGPASEHNLATCAPEVYEGGKSIELTRLQELHKNAYPYIKDLRFQLQRPRMQEVIFVDNTSYKHHPEDLFKKISQLRKNNYQNPIVITPTEQFCATNRDFNIYLLRCP